MPYVHIVDLHFQNIPSSIAAFLVETKHGLILIESGPYSTYERLSEAVKELGFQLSDIQQVLLTHIHLDHAGAAWALARLGAQIYVHPNGVRHLMNPDRLIQSARQIYGDQMEQLWGDMQPIDSQQITSLAHGQSIAIGEYSITAWHTPGHASHHIAWQLGDQLFTGDVGGVKILTGPIVPPCPPPDINIEQWKSSLQLMQQLEVKELYLTHFGKVTEVMTHLEVLETRLMDWALWVKAHYESGKSPAEVVPLFESYVANQLRAVGVREKSIGVYETANPSWMSVYGLMRYWYKQAL